MIDKLLAKLFDYLKKRSMEVYYLRGGQWGRDKSTTDIDSAIELVKDRRYERCLDVGTGHGYYAAAAASFSDEVLGIDISDLGIEEARKRYADLKNVQFEVMNARDLAGSDKFDLVILGDMIYYMGQGKLPDEFVEFLGRLAGLVRPGGRLLMSNFVAPWSSIEQSKNYLILLDSFGLVLEKEKVFTNEEGKQWHQVLTKK